MATTIVPSSGLTGLWMHANGVTLRLFPAGLSPGSCVPSSPAPGALSPWLSSGSGQQCTGIRPMSYGRHRLRDASSLSLMRVDAVRAMRTCHQLAHKWSPGTEPVPVNHTCKTINCAPLSSKGLQTPLSKHLVSFSFFQAQSPNSQFSSRNV